MEYPNSKLSKNIRRTIFYFFIFLFLIISPAVLMYTAGYRYDLKNGFLRITGSVNIDVLPNTAEVYLNNNKLKTKIPIRLNDLTAGKFSLTIKNPGYFDWQKNIEVVSKETVYIKDVVLIEKNQPVLLHEGEVEEISLSPDNKTLVYVVKKQDQKEIWQKNTKTGEKLLVIDSFPPEEPILITFSPNSNYYILSTDKKPYEKLFIVSAQKTKEIFDFAAYVKEPIYKFQWHDGQNSEIYYDTSSQIFTFFPETKSQIFVMKKNFLDWYMEGNKLWIIKENSSTNKMELIKDSLGFGEIFSEEKELSAKQWEILVAKNDFVLLKKINQAEMLLFTQNKKYPINGEKFFISKYNNWLITWTSWEIWTKAQNEEPALLNRSGMQLQQVLPLDKYNTLGLVWAGNTTVLFPYYLVSHELISQKINSAGSDSDNRILYFSGKHEDKDGLWKLKY
ncbi:MAG TPA: PEGA domain-containing protein [Candidatus Magasanikbacteria bacterium]|nr:PEGA domain-containing protein [Candidatus Magasanikbacteria bacterium]